MESIDKIWIALMEYGDSLGCHQIPERSFFFKGYQFPVCARCTGVILGYVLSIVAIVLGIRPSYYIVLVMILVMGLDWGIQRIGVLKSTNIRRLITGLSGGIGVTYFYFYILCFAYRIIKGIVQQMV
jgi:uncharacterized membrane protein